MRLYIDRDTRNFITSPSFNSAVTSVSFKRGDNYNIELGFVSNNTLTGLAGTPTIVFGIKQNGQYDGDFLVSSSGWTYDSTNKVYLGNPSFNTSGLNTLLGHDGTGNYSDDVSSITAMLEVTWHTGDAKWASAGTITSTIYNDVIKGVEGVPVGGSPAYPTAETIVTTYGDQSIDGAKTFNGDFVATGSSVTVGGEGVNSFGDNAATNTFGESAGVNVFGNSNSRTLLFGSPPTGGATSAANEGQFAVSGGYLYYATGANAWGRVQLLSW
jgi:hypothetical protein